MRTVITALTVFGGCTAARQYLADHNRKSEYWEGRIRLTTRWNNGAAFDLPIPARALPLASAAALGLLWAVRRTHPLGAGLVLGGGLSNLHERIQYGRVYDYVQFPKAPKPFRRYIFNLADFSIFVGAVLLLFKKR